MPEPESTPETRYDYYVKEVAREIAYPDEDAVGHTADLLKSMLEARFEMEKAGAKLAAVEKVIAALPEIEARQLRKAIEEAGS